MRFANLDIKFVIGFCYLLILSIGLFFLLTNIDIKDLLSYNFIVENKNIILDYKQSNFILLTTIFFIFSVLWVFFLGFGIPIVLFGGFVFGKWWGLLIVLFSFSVGSTMLYFMADIFFRDFIKKKIPKKFLALKELFRKNEFFYFLCYRLVGGGGLPFGLQNVLPVIFNMSVRNYFFATLLGLAPGLFVFVSLATGIEKIIDPNKKPEVFEVILLPEIYLPIAGFIFILIISFILKKIFFKKF